jgi:cilia- and flagella-associated protein 100
MFVPIVSTLGALVVVVSALCVTNMRLPFHTAHTHTPNPSLLPNIHTHTASQFYTTTPPPPPSLQAAKEKQRRNKLRLDKLEAQQKAQAERVQRALKMALAPVKKKTGKPVMFRSQPIQKKKKSNDDGAKRDEEEEERRYFFR